MLDLYINWKHVTILEEILDGSFTKEQSLEINNEITFFNFCFEKQAEQGKHKEAGSQFFLFVLKSKENP